MSQRQVLQGRPGRRRRAGARGPGPGVRGRAGRPLTRCPGAAARSFRAVPARPDAVRAGGGRARRPAAERRDPPQRRYAAGGTGRRAAAGTCAVRGRGDFRAPPPLRLTPGGGEGRGRWPRAWGSELGSRGGPRRPRERGAARARPCFNSTPPPRPLPPPGWPLSFQGFFSP